MFDINRTFMLIKGALQNPEKTWDDYLPEADDWKKTAVLLTGPLILGSALVAFILGSVFPQPIPFMPSASVSGLLLSLVTWSIAAVVIAFVFALIAGVFKGKNDFPRSLAATTFAFVPGYIGNALAPLPWIGGLLGLVLGIYGLVLLWRILPRYLEVPDSFHAGHYFLSLIASIVAFIILGTVIGVGRPTFDPAGFERTARMKSPRDDGGSTGMFGGMERQAKIMEAASEDTYDPPRNGKLTRAQVANFVTVMSKTREFRASEAERLEALSKKADEDKIESMGEVFSGLSNIMNISSAEMEVVKTGGGNWAEHDWIKEQLRVARVQKDLNDAVAHNYALYLEYEEDLKEFDNW